MQRSKDFEIDSTLGNKNWSFWGSRVWEHFWKSFEKFNYISIQNVVDHLLFDFITVTELQILLFDEFENFQNGSSEVFPNNSSLGQNFSILLMVFIIEDTQSFSSEFSDTIGHVPKSPALFPILNFDISHRNSSSGVFTEDTHFWISGSANRPNFLSSYLF